MRGRLRLGVAGCAAAAAAATADELRWHRVVRRNLRATAWCASLLVEYKLRWDPAQAHAIHARVARRLVDCLRDNGGLYVKFGQVLASLGHVLPPEYVRELARLHDDAAGVPFRDVARVIEEELGRPPHALFATFDERPVASASVAQVHRATTADGTEVAVKVQKPAVGVQNGWDLLAFWAFLHVIELAFEVPCVWGYEYTREQLEAELDFRVEARHARRCAAELVPALGGRLHVPPVCGALSARRVLTCEWVAGAAQVNDAEGLRRAGVDPADAMRAAVAVYARMLFVTGHVHCDPHPGNLLVRRAPGGGAQVCLIDHGLSVDMGAALVREYAELWRAMVLADGAALARVTAAWGVRDPEFFASCVQMAPYTVAGGAATMLRAGAAPVSGAALADDPRLLTSRQMAEAQEQLRLRAVGVLRDSERFPRPLMFVGRAMNYLRASNWAHGGAVNRVALLAAQAGDGLPPLRRARFLLTLRAAAALDWLRRTAPWAWRALLAALPAPWASAWDLALGAAAAPELADPARQCCAYEAGADGAVRAVPFG